MKNSDLVRVVLRHAKKGDKILIGRSHIGRGKIKIKHGALGWRSKRVEADAKTLQEVSEALRCYYSNKRPN